MQKGFYFSLICLLCGDCLAGPIDIESNPVLDIYNNWEFKVKSVAADFENNPVVPPKHEVLHVHHVPVTIPLYTSIVVHDKRQNQQQTETQALGTEAQPTNRPYGQHSCKASNGTGFTRLFAEAYELLPKPQIVKIIANAYKNDNQTRVFRNILFSKFVIEKLTAIGHSNEFEKLSDYACKRLYMDISSYFNIVRLLIAAKQEEYASDVSHDKEQSAQQLDSVENKGRPGVRGLMQDIFDILPRESLRQLYKRLKNSDYYLAYGVRNLKSSEFRRLLDNLRFLPEYRELRDMLIEAGLPLNEYNKLMAIAIGWESEAAQDVITV